MALFLSTFVNKVDRKGRVSVPATFRAALAAQRFPGIVAFPSFKFPALECCGIDRMEELSTRHELLEPFSDDYETMGELFSAAQELPFDGEGRIVLPAKFAEHAGITDQAAFVGQGRTFRIWEPQQFETHQAAVFERTRREGARVPSLAGQIPAPPEPPQ